MTSTVTLSTFVVVVLALSANAACKSLMSKLSDNYYDIDQPTDGQIADYTIQSLLKRPTVCNYLRLYHPLARLRSNKKRSLCNAR